jgi:hypothetical protein
MKENAIRYCLDRRDFDDFDYDVDAAIRTSKFNQASFDLKGFCSGFNLCSFKNPQVSFNSKTTSLKHCSFN